MVSGGHGTARAFLRIVSTLILAGGALALLGWLPTHNLGGTQGIQAMLAGIGVSLAASLIGTLPAHRAHSGHGATQEIVTILGSMGLRMAVALVLTLVLVLGTSLARAPLLIWVGLSYLTLLPLDLYLTLRRTRRGTKATQDGN